MAQIPLSIAYIDLAQIPHRSASSFSILNNSFDDDQDHAHADYIELSLQLQFNERSRSKAERGVCPGAGRLCPMPYTPLSMVNISKNGEGRDPPKYCNICIDS